MASPAPTSAAEKVLRHIVMYQFKPDVTPAQLQEVIDAFAGLPKKIDTIIGFEHGANVSKEGKSEGFMHVFVVTFKNEADRDAYILHPAHEAYVKVVRDRREKERIRGRLTNGALAAIESATGSPREIAARYGVPEGVVCKIKHDQLAAALKLPRPPIRISKSDKLLATMERLQSTLQEVLQAMAEKAD